MAARQQSPSIEGETSEGDDDIGVVARGRSVRIGRRTYLTDEEVILPADEIRSLRRRGFLVDPDAEPIKESNGPRFERR